MRAARLNTKVELQEPVIARDSFGAEAITWKNVASVWAEVDYSMKKAERFVSQTWLAEAEVVITIRFQRDITTRNRLVLNNQVFDIVNVINPYQRNSELTLLCKTRI